MVRPDPLAALERRGQLSPSGADWLTIALDPFHDFETPVRGMPDADTSAVVVEEVKQTIQVTVPSGVSGTWDSHVFFLPQALQQGLASCNYQDATLVYWSALQVPVSTSIPNQESATLPVAYGGSNMWAGNNNTQFGLLNVVSVDPGTDTLPGTGTNPTHYNTQFLAPPATLQSGKRRLIAAGFEIHNTTAEIYKQGTLTAYQVPQAESTIQMLGLDGTSYTTYTNTSNPLLQSPNVVPYQVMVQPPSTITEAMEYSGTRQWAAADGSYTVLRMDHGRNKLKQNEKQYPYYCKGDYVGGSAAVQPGLFTPSMIDDGTLEGYARLSKPLSAFTLPYHTSGVFLTGLSNQTTFTVTLRTYWEYAPSSDDQYGAALTYLAQPSPKYDALAFELYQAAIGSLPVAVPVGMNAAGDFWDGVLNVLSGIAPVVGSIIPGVGTAIGGAVGAGLQAVRAVRNTGSATKNQSSDAGKKRDDSEFKPAAPPGDTPAANRAAVAAASLRRMRVSAPRARPRAVSMVPKGRTLPSGK